jgi:hypothetical protein
MKTLILLSFSFFSLTLFSQNDCVGYAMSKEGASMEMTSYNKKGKATGIVYTEVLDVESEGKETKITIKSILYDENKKELKNRMKGNTELICSPDGIKIDISKIYLQEGQEKMFEDMEARIEGEFLNIPTNLTVGQTLPDGNVTIHIEKLGMKNTIKVFNRKVEARENITTPAGTFDCFKISEDVEVNFMFTFKTKSVSWVAKNIGTIKSESYRKDELSGSTLLTKLNTN